MNDTLDIDKDVNLDTCDKDKLYNTFISLLRESKESPPPKEDFFELIEYLQDSIENFEISPFHLEYHHYYVPYEKCESYEDTIYDGVASDDEFIPTTNGKFYFCE